MKYMKWIQLPVFLVSLILVTGCKKSEKQKAEVELVFQTINGSQNYSFADYFVNGDGIHMRLELLKFYLSDITFVNSKGKAFVASEIELVESDLNGKGAVTVKVPAGTYKSLKFGIGVKKEFNESNPSEFSEEGHPLNITQNTYWGMNSMYRFVMIDGRYDIEGDGISDGTFSYHTGYNESYREKQFDIDMTMDRKGQYSLTFLVDVTQFFSGPGGAVDVLTEPDYHGNTATVDLSYRISDNFASSLSVQK